MDESAVRQVIRLTRAVCVSPADSPSRRRRMIADLCDLMKASSGVSALLRLGSSQSRLESIIFIHAGAGETGKQVIQCSSAEPLNDKAWSRMIQMIEQGHISLARTRRQLLRDDKSNTHSLHRHAGVSDFDTVYSAFRLNSTTAAILSITRRREKKPFTSTDAHLIHLIHSELELLYNHFPESSRPGSRHLTPRQQEIHEYLLKGQGEKQIAARLGLSKHTIHAHIKAIYKYFRVASRPELLARFVRE